MSQKPKFARDLALGVAREICQALKPVTTRLIVAGSLRRMKSEVGDVEVLFVPAFGVCCKPGELFAGHGNQAENAILNLVQSGVLKPRESKAGTVAMGPKNKLLLHLATGIPVDLFTATEVNWWNYIVCRTGGKKHNMLIATRAQELGYKWHPYHSGFQRLSDGTVIPMTSERHVFEFLGLPWLEPKDRP